MTRTAAHVTHFATTYDFSGEAIEQFSVERLLLKLVEKSACVLFRDSIVAFANRLCDVVVHTNLLDDAKSAPAAIVPSGGTLSANCLPLVRQRLYSRQLFAFQEFQRRAATS